MIKNTYKSAYALYEGPELTLMFSKVEYFQEKQQKVKDSKY